MKQKIEEILKNKIQNYFSERKLEILVKYDYLSGEESEVFGNVFEGQFTVEVMDNESVLKLWENVAESDIYDRYDDPIHVDIMVDVNKVLVLRVKTLDAGDFYWMFETNVVKKKGEINLETFGFYNTIKISNDGSFFYPKEEETENHDYPTFAYDLCQEAMDASVLDGTDKNTIVSYIQKRFEEKNETRFGAALNKIEGLKGAEFLLDEVKLNLGGIEIVIESGNIVESE